MIKEEFIKYLGINGVSIFAFESEEEFMEELYDISRINKILSMD